MLAQAKAGPSHIHYFLHLMLSRGYRAYLCGKSLTIGIVHKFSNVSEDFCFRCVFAETEERYVVKLAANTRVTRGKQQECGLPDSSISINSKDCWLFTTPVSPNVVDAHPAYCTYCRRSVGFGNRHDTSRKCSRYHEFIVRVAVLSSARLEANVRARASRSTAHEKVNKVEHRLARCIPVYTVKSACDPKRRAMTHGHCCFPNSW
jgi:hypothetical protein